MEALHTVNCVSDLFFLAARRFVRAFTGVQRPTQSLQVLLATAHCTLAGEQNLSLPRRTMHLNAAIRLLKKVLPPYPSHKRSIPKKQYIRPLYCMGIQNLKEDA